MRSGGGEKERGEEGEPQPRKEYAGDRSSRKGDEEESCKQTERRLSGEFTEEDTHTHKKMGVVFKSGSEMRGRSDAPRKCGLGRGDRPGPWRRASAASARGQRAAGSEDTGVRGIGGCAGS